MAYCMFMFIVADAGPGGGRLDAWGSECIIFHHQEDSKELCALSDRQKLHW